MTSSSSPERERGRERERSKLNRYTVKNLTIPTVPAKILHKIKNTPTRLKLAPPNIVMLLPLTQPLAPTKA